MAKNLCPFDVLVVGREVAPGLLFDTKAIIPITKSTIGIIMSISISFQIWGLSMNDQEGD